MLPTLARWEKALHYLETHPQIVDVVVSGGDAYYLTPKQLLYIGQHLIRIPSIKKFRFASKGLAVAPNRILDPDDPCKQKPLPKPWPSRDRRTLCASSY